MQFLQLFRATALVFVVVVFSGCRNKQGNSETSPQTMMKLENLSPSGQQNDDLTADYPNPQIAQGAVTTNRIYDEALTKSSSSNGNSSNSNVTPSKSNSNSKIIKNATIRIRVKDFQTAGSQIEEIIKRHGAYFSSQTESNSVDFRENHAVIRVGNEKFDALVKELVSIAERVDSKNTSVDDVTGQFVDIQARLKVKKETESRFYEILKQARTVSDILEVQEKINEIREEIDASEGRLQLLSDQVTFSTVNLEYYERLTQATTASEDSFGENLTRGFSNGWHGLLSLIVFAVTVWPFWIACAIFLFIIIKSAKRMRRQTKSDTVSKT
ncbi:MAG: DUF4349 domain-containing protein [Ignavibacteria bacterium]|nr:DUF4349 domain-containing protein [Ignavibacteria bacterium]